MQHRKYLHDRGDLPASNFGYGIPLGPLNRQMVAGLAVVGGFTLFSWATIGAAVWTFA